MKTNLITLVLIFLFSCSANEQQKPVDLPYDLSAPEKFIMSNALAEISGIAIRQSSDTIYAIQDEEGILFSLVPGSDNVTTAKFGKKGDYEDLAIVGNTVYILKSNGAIYSVPLNKSARKAEDQVEEFKDLVPQGEYEGMYGDESNNKLYILCKNCKKVGEGAGYTLSIAADGQLSASEPFSLNVDAIQEITNNKKVNFRPSAITKNKSTNEWFVLSSVNNMLVRASADWTIKNVYSLDPSIFVQPEGIAFDSKNNLYISNEAGTTSNGNILKFNYRPAK